MANTEKNKVLDLDGLNRYDELLKQMITGHTSDKDNPHAVTKEQIGLGSVENKSVAEILAAMTSDDVTKALGFTPQKQGASGGGSSESYGFATETEAGIIMSGGDISVNENGIVTVTGMGDTNVGSDVRPIYFKDGKPVVGYYTLAEAAGKGVTNITEVGNLGWLNSSTGGLFVPTLNTLAFWNGEYAEGMSSIEYFKLGKFGSMATRSEEEFLETGDIADWAKADDKPEYTYSEVGADKAGSADTALASAKEYALTTINNKIAELINSAPETMDTLGELATLMTSNQEAVDILNEAIAKRATTSDLTAHTENTSNPHGVTKAQVGLDKVDNTADADKSVKYASTAGLLEYNEANSSSNAYGNIWFSQDDAGKLVQSATFQYNPYTDTLKVGNITGKSANAATADALTVAAAIGSATNPVYIDESGKPVKTTFTLGASVPADAKFTDTTYSQATSSNLGLVKVGTNITNTDGTISLTKENVTAALGYTPPSLDNFESTYLPRTGGIMNASASIVIPGTDDGSTSYGESGINFKASTGSWSSSHTFLNNEGTSVLGAIGAYGTADMLDFYYFGTSWDTAAIKAYNDGRLIASDIKSTTSTINDKVTLSYSDTTDSLSFNFA